MHDDGDDIEVQGARGLAEYAVRLWATAKSVSNTTHSPAAVVRQAFLDCTVLPAGAEVDHDAALWLVIGAIASATKRSQLPDESDVAWAAENMSVGLVLAAWEAELLGEQQMMRRTMATITDADFADALTKLRRFLNAPYER